VITVSKYVIMWRIQAYREQEGERERERERLREKERDRNVLSTFATDSYRKMTVEWATKTINGSDSSLTNVSMYHLYLCIYDCWCL